MIADAANLIATFMHHIHAMVLEPWLAVQDMLRARTLFKHALVVATSVVCKRAVHVLPFLLSLLQN